VDTVSLLYSYLTQGHFLQAVNTNGQVIGILAYYYGTPEEDIFQISETGSSAKVCS